MRKTDGKHADQVNKEITEVGKQWQEAREHVSEMRKTDGKQADQVNKEITELGNNGKKRENMCLR